MSLSDLRRGFEAGRVPRDSYWQQAQVIHRRLRDYFTLMENGTVKEIRIRRAELVVELEGGVRMAWDPDDLRTAPSVLVNHGTYEATELRALLRIAEQCEVVFDIGANVGWYAVNLARVVSPRGGRVYAFEPIPTTFSSLQRNIALNNLAHAITAEPIALGDAPGNADFFVPRVTGSVAASRRQILTTEDNARIGARVETVDDVASRLNLSRLDLVKCDVEGGELMMLRGAQRTIDRFRPVLFLEMLRKWSRAYDYHPDDIIAFLARLGYRCFAVTDNGLAETKHVDEECVHTNFLFFQETHTAFYEPQAPITQLRQV
jgi:FkbM family methyltransferase